MDGSNGNGQRPPDAIMSGDDVYYLFGDIRIMTGRATIYSIETGKHYNKPFLMLPVRRGDDGEPEPLYLILSDEGLTSLSRAIVGILLGKYGDLT